MKRLFERLPLPNGRAHVLLRIVVVAMVGWGVSATLLGPKFEQRRIVHAVQAVGGNVRYDDNECLAPGWLIPVSIQQFFANVRVVEATGPAFGDELLVTIGRLPRLCRVFLVNSGVTDAGLLRFHHSLGVLQLDGSAVTDTGLENIQELAPLYRLSLARTKITDAGMARIAKVPTICLLSVAGTAVSDRSVLQLFNLRDLRVLDLSRTLVTDSGLRQLHSLGLGLNSSTSATPQLRIWGSSFSAKCRHCGH